MVNNRNEHREPVIRAFVALPMETLVEVIARCLPGSGLCVSAALINRNEQFMQYQKIWDKVLNPNEVIKYEFSIGPFYRKLCMVLWSLFGVLFLFSVDTAIFGIIVILLAAFYYLFYLKVANAYAFSDDRVLIHKGWLSTKLISTEYQKITNVTVHDPFISRIITKTGTLVIDTAGTSGKEIQLTRIERPYEVKKKLDELRTNR